jgi:hypothetical protein
VTRIEFWPTKTDGTHVVLIADGVVRQVGVLWI